MASVATAPVYPAPGRAVEITVTLTQAGTNFARFWVTSAPRGSELQKGLDDPSAARIEWKAVDAADPVIRHTFDKGGAYTFTVQEYTRGASGYGGAYEGDPSGAPSETKVGSESSLTIYVGQRMTMPLGFPPDDATLVLWVWNDTIRATTLATHGENSPRIDTTGKSVRAQAAATSNTYTPYLSADNLVGLTASTAIHAGNGIDGLVDEFGTKFLAHIGSATFHSAADSDNAITPEYYSNASASTLKDFCNAALKSVRQHFTNDNGAGTGVGSAAYHNGVSGKADYANMPLATGADDSNAYIVLADLWGCYEFHRITGTHDSADTTNQLLAGSPPKLLLVHIQYLHALRELAPGAPPGGSVGATRLIQEAKMKESPL